MHEIKNPRELNIILDNIVTKLNSSGLFFASLNEELYTLVIEYFMKKLELQNSRVEYPKLDKGELAKISETGNIISVSKSMLSNRNQMNLTTSIAHELKHLHQKKTPKRYKTTDMPVTNLYPIKKCTLDSYQEDFRGEINTHDYYITSFSEKDARDYANTQTIKLLENIKLHKNCTAKTEKWADKQISILSKNMQKEDEEFAQCLEGVLRTCTKLEHIIPSKIDLALSQMETKYATLNTVIGNSRTFDKYLYFYCNDDITKKIFDFALKTKDMDSIVMCVNHPNTKISEQNFLDMLSIYSPNNKIKDTYTLSQLLDNWTTSEINRLCNIYNKKFEQTKNTKKTKIAQLRKYKDTKKSQTPIVAKIVKKYDIYE